MKKLTLDRLTVDSFPTVRAPGGGRGTVAGHEIDTTLHCPDSYGGTCWITCFDTCPCTDSPDCA
jgi:hypothetical protein